MEAAVRHIRGRVGLRLWQVTLVAGLVVLALHYVGHVSEGGPRLYETWFYEGLELLAALGCLTRAVFVRDERSAWAFIGAALLATTCGDVLYDFWYGGNPPFPSVADPALPRLLPAALRRDRAPASPARLDLQREPLARRAGGALRGGGTRRLRARRGGRQLDAREPAGRGHEPRLSARRHAPPRPRGLRLLGHRWRPGRAWALIAAGLLLDSVGDAVYLYQVAVGHLRRGHVPRSRLAALAPPPRARRVAAAGARLTCRSSRTARCSARRSSAA